MVRAPVTTSGEEWDTDKSLNDSVSAIFTGGAQTVR
jgi:hypothetical protein